MKQILFFVFLHSFLNLNGQNYYHHKAQFGLSTGGDIRNITKLNPPHYRDIWSVAISIYPRIGYNFSERLMLGGVGNYTLHRGTLNSANSIYGYGYFLHYRFINSRDTSTKFRRVITHIEFEHSLSDGYYAFLNDLKVLKIQKKVNYLILVGGVDLRFMKGFLASVDFGIHAFNFYKNDFDPTQGEKFSIRPVGRVTFQHTLKF